MAVELKNAATRSNGGSEPKGRYAAFGMKDYFNGFSFSDFARRCQFQPFITALLLKNLL